MAETKTGNGREPDRPTAGRGRLRRLAIAIVLVAVVTTVAVQWRSASRGRVEGVAAAARGNSSLARQRLEDYLGWFSGDDEARLLLARAIITDDSLGLTHAVDLALEQLDHVDDSSPVAALAHARAGRLLLLLAHRPAAAQHRIQLALDLDPELVDAHLVAWKLYDLTRRGHRVEPHFWKVLDAAQGSDQKRKRLQEWYFSQFVHGVATGEMDRNMGFLEQDQTPNATTEFHRLIEFRSAEPLEPLGHAAVAGWFLAAGDPEQAWRVLDETAELAGARQHPLWIATAVACLLELGRFEDAANFARDWPETQHGHTYWRLTGRVIEEAERDDLKAVDAYRKAIDAWPGHSDWKTRYRLAGCLQRLGQDELAETERARAEAVRDLMRQSTHERLLQLAAETSDAGQRVEFFRQFYRALGRPAEQQAWTSLNHSTP